MKIDDIIEKIKKIKVKIPENKIVLYALIIVYVVSILCNIFLFITKGNMQKENADLAREFTSLSSSNKERLKFVNELEKRFNDSEKTVKNLSRKLSEEMKKDTKFADKIKTQEEEINKLKSGITAYARDNKNLLRRISLLNEAFDDIKIKFDGLIDQAERESEKEIAGLNKQIEKLSKEKETTSLGTIIVR